MWLVTDKIALLVVGVAEVSLMKESRRQRAIAQGLHNATLCELQKVAAP